MSSEQSDQPSVSRGREIAPGLFHVAGIRLEKIGSDSLVAILLARDEAWRLPFWLAYHRWLGVDHFIIIDNRSKDDTQSLLREQKDVTLIDAPGAFYAGHRAWTKAIIEMGPADRWHLILDADELFVAAPWRQGGLRQTVSALEAEGADFAFALMVDCYPDFLPQEAKVVSAIPWVRAPWFDPGPYGRWRQRKRKIRLHYGGVRERVCWPRWKYQKYIPRQMQKWLSISHPPFIVKVPLVRGAAGAGGSIHRTSSRRRPTSYFNLLHYKFDIDLAPKVQTAVAEGQYYNQSIEYKGYAAALAGGRLPLKTAISRRFTSLTSLRDASLCRYDRSFLDSVGASGPIDTDPDQAIAEIFQHGDRRLVETISVSEVTGPADCSCP